jgi:hypothetical protein
MTEVKHRPNTLCKWYPYTYRVSSTGNGITSCRYEMSETNIGGSHGLALYNSEFPSCVTVEATALNYKSTCVSRATKGGYNV